MAQGNRSQVQFGEHLFGVFNSKDGMIQVRVVAYQPDGGDWKAPKIEPRRLYGFAEDGTPKLGKVEAISLELFENLMADDQKGWTYLCTALGKAKEWYLKLVQKQAVKAATSTTNVTANAVVDALVQKQKDTDEKLDLILGFLSKQAAPVTTAAPPAEKK